MADPSTWGLALSLTAIAIVGKQVCAFGVTEKGLNRIAIGIGMIPRGEVGLIFADQGRRLIAHGEPVISDSTFSAIIFMVMVTTLVTPPILGWALNRWGSRGPQDAEPTTARDVPGHAPPDSTRPPAGHPL
jgi:Kef-type K+ transport system membrane component KefB